MPWGNVRLLDDGRNRRVRSHDHDCLRRCGHDLLQAGIDIDGVAFECAELLRQSCACPKSLVQPVQHGLAEGIVLVNDADLANIQRPQLVDLFASFT